MKRTDLIEMMVAVTAVAVLSGNASASTLQRTVDIPQVGAGELGVARNAWMECIRAAIPALDVPPATADEVARAAMTSCSARHSDMTQALTRTVESTCGQDSKCTQAALAKAERDAARTVLDEVTAERIRVANAQVLKCQ